MVTPFEKAKELINCGNNIFITGGGGVGKSYLLTRLKEHYGNDLQITSTTGISAINVGGQTIHSWAGVGKMENPSISSVVRKIRSIPQTFKRIKSCKMLAIDEISMFDDYQLKYINLVCQEIRKNNAPFGGIQIILLGDFFQLAPVSLNKKDEVLIEKRNFCFKGDVWKELNLITILLKEVKRQNDKSYIQALNNIRLDIATEDDLEIFRNREMSNLTCAHQEDILNIFGRNEKARAYNAKCFNLLDTPLYKYHSKDTLYKYDMDEIVDEITLDEGNTISSSDIDYWLMQDFNRYFRVPQILELKKGCRVMLLKNLDIEKGLANGSCGSVTDLSQNTVEVTFDNGVRRKLEKAEFEYKQDGKVKIRRYQYPLTLAYGITVHKSQGMTFDNLVVNFNNIFGFGMAYVALSRTKTIDGLYIKGFDENLIIADPDVVDFYEELEQSENCIIFDEEKENDEDNEIQDNTTDEMTDDVNDDVEVINSDTDETIVSYEEKAEEYFENEEYEKAVEYWYKVLNSGEDVAIDYLHLGQAEYELKKYEDAKESFDIHIENFPDCAEAYHYRGIIETDSDEYEKAYEDLKKSIELEPDEPLYYYTLGLYYQETGEYSLSISNLNKALELDEDYNDIVYKEKAEIYHKLAIEDYNKIQELSEEY